MKNFLLAVFGLFAALPPCAANNIKMVTYFPVPYASYNDLKVSGTCDVGLLDDCTLDAGSSLRVLKDASRTNNEGKLEVLRGALSLNGSGSIYGNSLQFGINSVSGGELQFKHNLNVTTMPGSVITSIQVSNQAKLNKLNLFEKYEFPGCDGTDNEINWKRLTVNGAEGVFLVCGAGKTTEKTCAQDPNQQKCCNPSTEKWNGSECVPLCDPDESPESCARCGSGKWDSIWNYCCTNLNSQECCTQSGGNWNYSAHKCEGSCRFVEHTTRSFSVGSRSDTYLPTCGGGPGMSTWGWSSWSDLDYSKQNDVRTAIESEKAPSGGGPYYILQVGSKNDAACDDAHNTRSFIFTDSVSAECSHITGGTDQAFLTVKATVYQCTCDIPSF